MDVTQILSQILPSCILGVLGYIAKNSMSIKRDVSDIRKDLLAFTEMTTEKFDAVNEKVDDTRGRVSRLERLKLIGK